MITLNLEKSSLALKLSLEKKGLIKPPVIEVAIALDVSASFEDEHQSGITSDLLTRLAPWGLTFDPDQKLDVFTFSSGPENAHHVGEMTAKNYQNFVRKRIINKVPGWGGATDYSYVLGDIFQHFGHKLGAGGILGFLQRFLGGSQPKVAEAVGGRKRSVVFFITDGENNDKGATRSLLSRAEREGCEVYVMFLGVSNQPGEFGFIEKLGEEFDNIGFLAIRDLKALVRMDDDALNELLLVPELLRWLDK